MSHSIAEIAAALGATAEGALDHRVRGAAEPSMAGPDDLALAMEPRYAAGLSAGKAQAAVLWPGADWRAMGLKAAIFVPRPRSALAPLTSLLDPGPGIARGVHPSAIIDPLADIGSDVWIGPLAVIARGARIGDGSRIGAHAMIGAGTDIGAQALILSGARIMARVRIGARFICQPGAVVGSDGFSFVTAERSSAERARESLGAEGGTGGPQNWQRIHSLGGVEIGDDVEIGANAAIDRGTIRATRIGSGSKLDNLVHVAHNVEIGRDCLICGQVGIAGSARIGDRVVLGGQCGVSDNIFVGDDVVAGGGTKIYTNAPAGRVLLGAPALKMETHVEAWKNIRRLTRLFRDVATLKARMGGKSDAE